MEEDVSLVLGPAGQAAYRFGDRVYQLRVEAVSPGFRRGSWQTLSFLLAPAEARGPTGCWVTLRPHPLSPEQREVHCAHGLSVQP